MIRCIDVETSGLEATDAIVEIGWCDLTQDADGKWTFGLPQQVLVNPLRPIPPVASAIHHIVDADVRDAPALKEALEEHKIIAPVIEGYAAHNAAFEAMFLKLDPLICTWRTAIHMARSAPGHKLQELRYWLKLDVDREVADKGHRAGPDAYVCAALLTRMLNAGKMSVREMIVASGKPVDLPRFHFGMHANKPVEEIPDGYLEWCMKQGDMDPDVKFTAFQELGRRRTKGGKS